MGTHDRSKTAGTPVSVPLPALEVKDCLGNRAFWCFSGVAK